MDVTAGGAAVSLSSYQSHADSVVLVRACNDTLNKALEF